MPMSEQALLDCAGRPVPVNDVVDIPEQLRPTQFWARVPPASFDSSTAASSLWSYGLLRRHFCAVDVALPGRVLAYHSALRTLPATLGRAVDLSDPAQQAVIAGDIAYHPIATAHPRTTGTYSASYYPRRTGDWLENDYLPAFALSDDPRIETRMSELLDFMLFSQYGDDGANEFTATYFPDEFAAAEKAGLTRQWAGGWDYLFDWEWRDAYGYLWQLHEPDHHVNGQMAAAMVRAYELTGNGTYLESARRFVYHQVPRYGFHTGSWQGKTYYWTEYNPSGPGNPTRDATDNIQALAAQAIAMVGLRTGDRRMLEFARGLLWHCIREWRTDGRWYYDSAENPLNSRKAISHDMAVLLPLLAAVPYLINGGVRLDAELDVLEEAYEFYVKNYESEPMTGIRNGQLSTLAPEQTDGERRQITSYYAANQPAAELTFSHKPPTSSTITLHISRLSPPRDAGGEWSVDPTLDEVNTVPAATLAQGIRVKHPIRPGDVVRFAYPVADAADIAAVPATIHFTDPGGNNRTITARAPTGDCPTNVTADGYVRAATRLMCPPPPV